MPPPSRAAAASPLSPHLPRQSRRFRSLSRPSEEPPSQARDEVQRRLASPASTMAAFVSVVDKDIMAAFAESSLIFIYYLSAMVMRTEVWGKSMALAFWSRVSEEGGGLEKGGRPAAATCGGSPELQLWSRDLLSLSAWTLGGASDAFSLQMQCRIFVSVFHFYRDIRKINPAKYKNISYGFGVLLKEQGARGFFRGWVPPLIDYSCQGACKFGFYEFFKKYYSVIAGPEKAAKYKTLIYLAGSASAEVIADVALCPMEAVKVHVQTQPDLARGLSNGLPKFVKAEGYAGLYKGIVPLWG